MEELERTAEQLQSQAAAEAPEESEEEKRERVRRELQKVAKEQAERRETAKQMFELGQKAYGKGMYGRSIEFLEAALTIIRPSSLLGGEIQIWLAMAYEANRRHKDCIALYKELESSHPMINIRRQAAELRYILEAPKLKISNDEVVTIPQIGSSWDWYAGTWSDKIKEQEDKKRKMSAASNQVQPSPNIFGDLSFLRPPNEWKKSAWVVVTLWILLIGTAIYLQS
nr:unknown [Zea mays]